MLGRHSNHRTHTIYLSRTFFFKKNTQKLIQNDGKKVLRRKKIVKNIVSHVFCVARKTGLIENDKQQAKKHINILKYKYINIKKALKKIKEEVQKKKKTNHLFYNFIWLSTRKKSSSRNRSALVRACVVPGHGMRQPTEFFST